jgi:uncharacterized protein
MWFNSAYFMYVMPGIILAIVATIVTKSTFAKYSRVGASSGLTGAEAARRMLDSEGIHGVNIEMTGGMLTDHYDPRTNTLRLSPGVFESPSLAAIGVACHEAGHALQKAHDYAPLGMRSALVPVTNFGSHAAVPLIMLGFIMKVPFLVQLGIIVFAAVVVFSVVTLPVEWNASARAKRLMVSAGIVSPQESVHAGKVLNAAFLTYVASAVTALLTLLYYLSLGNRRH